MPCSGVTFHQNGTVLTSLNKHVMSGISDKEFQSSSHILRIPGILVSELSFDVVSIVSRGYIWNPIQTHQSSECACLLALPNIFFHHIIIRPPPKTLHVLGQGDNPFKPRLWPPHLIRSRSLTNEYHRPAPSAVLHDLDRHEPRVVLTNWHPETNEHIPGSPPLLRWQVV